MHKAGDLADLVNLFKKSGFYLYHLNLCKKFISLFSNNDFWLFCCYFNIKETYLLVPERVKQFPVIKFLKAFHANHYTLCFTKRLQKFICTIFISNVYCIVIWINRTFYLLDVFANTCLKWNRETILNTQVFSKVIPIFVIKDRYMFIQSWFDVCFKTHFVFFSWNFITASLT